MKIALAALVALTPLAAAQAMPVSDFLTKAETLKKKGPMALFSSDYKKLKGEVQNAGQVVRAREAADRKAGRKPATCLPNKDATDSDELLAYFKSIPPAQRNISVNDAFFNLMKRKFPCAA